MSIKEDRYQYMDKLVQKATHEKLENLLAFLSGYYGDSFADLVITKLQGE